MKLSKLVRKNSRKTLIFTFLLCIAIPITSFATTRTQALKEKDSSINDVRPNYEMGEPGDFGPGKIELALSCSNTMNCIDSDQELLSIETLDTIYGLNHREISKIIRFILLNGLFHFLF